MSGSTLMDMDYPVAGDAVSATPPAPDALALPLVRPVGYDPRHALPAGQVLTRETELALLTAFHAGGDVPLTADQAVAAAGPALPYPAGLPCLDRDTCTGSWRDAWCGP